MAGFVQESVTFIDVASTLQTFQATESWGEQMLQRHRGANTPTAGFIEVCEQAGCEIVPIVYAGAAAAGPTTDEAYDHYVQHIIKALREQGPFDGVLLDLHGAMTTPSRLDADADTLEQVRAVIGDETPLMVALDYHANIDQRTVDYVDALFGYHYSPHIDMAETGQRTAQCMLRTLRGEIRPVTVIRKPGVMVPSIFSATGLEPLKSLVDRSVDMANQQAYLDVSVFAGFSYADVPNCGFSVVVVNDNQYQAAQALAQSLSDEIFALRQAINHPELLFDIETGIAQAQRIKAGQDKLVVLLEHADRMGDSTYLLRACMDTQLARTYVPYLTDPYAVHTLESAQVGSMVKVNVGGHSSERAGGAVSVEGRLIFKGEKSYYATGPYFTGRLVDLGMVAVIDTGSVVVSLTSLQSTAIDEDCFKQLGLNIQDFDYVVLRSKTHFRAAYDQLAAGTVIIDTPDWGMADIRQLTYHHVDQQNTYPLNA